MEQLDYKELAARTHLDARRIKAVMERDFAALEGANVPMTLKILERELGEDFTAWREEYAAWSADHCKNTDVPKIAPTLQGYTGTPSAGDKEGSRWFAWLLVIAALSGGGVYFGEELRDAAAHLFERTSNLSSVAAFGDGKTGAQTTTGVAKIGDKSEVSGEEQRGKFIVKPTQKYEAESEVAGEKTAASGEESAQEAAGVLVNDTQKLASKEAQDTAQKQGANEAIGEKIDTFAQPLPATQALLTAKTPSAPPAAPAADESATQESAAADEAADATASSAASAQLPDAGDLAAAQPADEPGETAEQLKKELTLAKPAPLSIRPHKVAWLSIKDLSSGKTRNFSITKAHKITTPSLIFVGTTAYEIELGSKPLAAPGRYFIYDGKGVRSISKAEYVRLNAKGR